MQRANYPMSDNPLHPRPIQQLHQHRAQCTHIHLSRVFNEQVLCIHCGRPGNMGWVYRCTQDSDGRVPIDESGLDEIEQSRLKEIASRNGWFLPGIDPTFPERKFRTEGNHGEVTSLKPWMKKAAASGEYTTLQVHELITQRMEVKRKIYIQEMSARLSKDSTSVLQPGNWVHLKTMTGEETSVHTTGLDGQETGVSKDRVELDMGKNVAESMAGTYKKPSSCDYKCCAACRPIMRDRAWLSIDSIIHPEDRHMFPDNLDVRPMASRNVILGISSFNEDTDDKSPTSSSDQGSSEGLYMAESNRRIRHRRSASFIENVRQVYEDYVAGPAHRSRSANSISQYSSQQSSYSDEMDITDIADDERMAALGVERPESRMGDFWMDDPTSSGNVSWLPPGVEQHMRQDSISSIVASTASHSDLPVQETPASGELHIGAGVAVTEEAVDLGMADIITQV